MAHVLEQSRSKPTEDGRYIYLDRYDHDWDFFDHQLRPSPEPEACLVSGGLWAKLFFGKTGGSLWP